MLPRAKTHPVESVFRARRTSHPCFLSTNYTVTGCNGSGRRGRRHAREGEGEGMGSDEVAGQRLLVLSALARILVTM